jgi:hypothetical protein
MQAMHKQSCSRGLTDRPSASVQPDLHGSNSLVPGTQEELRDQERLALLREAERMREEELRAAVERKLAGAALIAEVAAANSEQIARKEALKVTADGRAGIERVHHWPPLHWLLCCAVTCCEPSPVTCR